jgi:hypothetical protein
MAKGLISKDSYTSQVIKVLERQISTGALPPLTKLASVRQLAKKFEVSNNVILFALDELEKKRLIYRQKRKGVFVSEMASSPDKKEVLVFVFGDSPTEPHPFVTKTFSLLKSPAAENKFNFYIRAVSLTAEQMTDLKTYHRLLDAEIAKLSHTFHSDCALIIAPGIDADGIAQCAELPFPSLFIGNFSCGDLPELSYNRFGEVENYYSHAVAYALEKQFTNICLLVSKQVLTSQHFGTACRLLEERAFEEGLGFQIQTVEHMLTGDLALRKRALTAAVEHIQATCDGNSLILTSCIPDLPVLIEALERGGFRHQQIVAMELPFVLTSGDLPVSICPPAEAENFNGRLCELIVGLAEGNLTNHREDFEVHHVIVPLQGYQRMQLDFYHQNQRMLKEVRL